MEKHSEYEAIIDGANVGLYQQNFADGGFSLSQVLTLPFADYLYYLWCILSIALYAGVHVYLLMLFA